MPAVCFPENDSPVWTPPAGHEGSLPPTFPQTLGMIKLYIIHQSNGLKTCHCFLIFISLIHSLVSLLGFYFYRMAVHALCQPFIRGYCFTFLFIWKISLNNLYIHLCFRHASIFSLSHFY